MVADNYFLKRYRLVLTIIICDGEDNSHSLDRHTLRTCLHRTIETYVTEESKIQTISLLLMQYLSLTPYGVHPLR
jgi:hypothetical protein